MTNNLNKLNQRYKELKQEQINRWNEISENKRQDIAELLAIVEIFGENCRLLLKIDESKQEKEDLRKTLMAELAGGVYETHQRVIAEKEAENKAIKAESIEYVCMTYE